MLNLCFSNMHHSNVIQRRCEVISGNFVFLPEIASHSRVNLNHNVHCFSDYGFCFLCSNWSHSVCYCVVCFPSSLSCLHGLALKLSHVTNTSAGSLKERGGFHGSVHVSKSRCFCSLFINSITLKTSLRCHSVITCYS